MKRYTRAVRTTTVILCELAVLYTAVLACRNGEYAKLVPALGSGVLVLFPLGLERILSFRLNNVLFISSTAYAIGPMLGHCLKLYYTVPWWDKMLHFYGGIVFALLGWHLFGLVQRDHGKKLAFALFALFFSVTLSVMWEFVEFGIDMTFDNDMMDDTVITRLDSYLLGSDVGEIGHVENIRCVTVDGKELEVDGYIDIGLIDTMTDMLLETAGALIAVVLCCVGNKSVGIEKCEK